MIRGFLVQLAIAEMRSLRASVDALRVEVRDLTATIGARLGPMSIALDNLTVAVNNNTNAEQSAIALINGLAAQIKSASPDPAIQALADQINANASALAAAVVANTPAAAPTPSPATP